MTLVLCPANSWAVRFTEVFRAWPQQCNWEGRKDHSTTTTTEKSGILMTQGSYATNWKLPSGSHKNWEKLPCSIHWYRSCLQICNSNLSGLGGVGKLWHLSHDSYFQTAVKYYGWGWAQSALKTPVDPPFTGFLLPTTSPAPHPLRIPILQLCSSLGSILLTLTAQTPARTMPSFVLDSHVLSSSLWSRVMLNPWLGP